MPDIFKRLKRLLRLRFAVLYPLGIYMIFFTTPGYRSTMWGALLMAAGLLMRLWSNGYAIKLDKLTTSGPYSFVRNPLYVGTALIILGFMVMLKMILVGAAFFVVLAAVYTRTIRNEQKMLTDKFGIDYLDYCAKVPALWPTLRPYGGGVKWPFSIDRLWQSREHKVVLWVTIIVIAFHIKKICLMPGYSRDVKVVQMLSAIGALILFDILCEYRRFRGKKL